MTKTFPHSVQGVSVCINTILAIRTSLAHMGSVKEELVPCLLLTPEYSRDDCYFLQHWCGKVIYTLKYMYVHVLGQRIFLNTIRVLYNYAFQLFKLSKTFSLILVFDC